jgi:hypothetical protein
MENNTKSYFVFFAFAKGETTLKNENFEQKRREPT